MKRDELKQVAALTIKELKVKATGLKKEIATLTMDKNMKKLKDTRGVAKKKKELAQVLTFARQKELLEELESKVKKEKGEN